MASMLEYKGYHATVDFDAEDNLFVGEVFGVSDSLNFHGASVEELQAMFHQSIDNYLSLCQKIGKNPDKEFKGSFNVRIPIELHRQAALAAKRRHLSLNQYVVQAISNTYYKKAAAYQNYVRQLFCNFSTGAIMAPVGVM